MNLEDIRTDIDRIDAKILSLLNERMEKALLTRRFKSGTFDPTREQVVLDKVRHSSQCLLDPQFSVKIYEQMMAESRRIQEASPQTVAFQGEHGAYSEVALRILIPHAATIPCREFSDVFDGVEKGIYDYGIVPVENTLGGIVGPVNSILIYTTLKIVAAIDMPVRHCLLTVPGADHRELRTAWSHTQALAQCRNFLQRNHLDSEPYYDTAGAAKALSENRPKGIAAVASKFAGELYGLETIKEDIQDSPHNRTRFFLISARGNGDEGDKCSAVFTAGNKAGSLFAVLKVFAEEKINLTRIESVPDTPGKYAIFIDFEGALASDAVQRAVGKVSKMAEDFKILGCYREMRVEE
ncbi:Prephenate dehydratase [uncultured spirochete]|uniref:Bifunctional chorismate mutase/prephenate dehydratase n=1 Tax=uncultured spirochete TaxID=156406 RepID=A0A3P3XUS6_9SPIR|nr:Prephenate dehydratase [uncultured spirochete]